MNGIILYDTDATATIAPNLVSDTTATAASVVLAASCTQVAGSCDAAINLANGVVNPAIDRSHAIAVTTLAMAASLFTAELTPKHLLAL